MGQLSLFPIPYKYIIDTSSLLSQKHDRGYRRSVFKGQWEKTDEYIANQIIVTCAEVESEIEDKEVIKHFNKLCPVVLPIDYDIQDNVRKIVTENPKMIEFTANGKGSSSGDAFLIATAMKYNLIVITQENTSSSRKIPQICQKYGIETISIIDLWEREDWIF